MKPIDFMGALWIIPFFKQKIRTKLAILVFVCTTIPLLALYLVNDFLTRDAMKREVGRRQESTSLHIITDLDRFLYESIEHVKAWAENPILKQLGQDERLPEISKYIKGVNGSFGTYAGMFLVNRFGVLRGSTKEELVGDDLSLMNWFTSIRTRQQVDAFDLVQDPLLDQLTVNIAVPIVGPAPDRAFIGVLSVHLSWKEIMKVVSQGETNEEGVSPGSSLLLNRVGKIIAAPRSKVSSEDPVGTSAFRNLASEDFESVLEAINGQSGYGIEASPFDGKSNIVGYAHSKGFKDFKGFGWSVLSYLETEVAFSSLERVRTANQTISLIAIALAFFTFMFLGYRIIQKLEVLKHLMQGVGGGDFSVNFAADSGDEIDDLAYAFKKMTLELKENHQRLIDAKEEAEGANRAKSTFLANISHDLRTPLNGIIGMADILAQSKLTLEQKESVEIIISSGDSLLSLINDLLDVSKIEAGKIQIEKEKVDIRLLVEEMAQLLAPAAYMKKVEFFLDFAADVPKFAHLDKSRVRQILINLAGNAIKFTIEGSVRIRVSRADQILFFDILDTGIGIQEHHGSSLFQPFFQADISSKRTYEGAGLGLYICASLVKAMGGEINFESKPHVGSKFQVTMPSCLTYPELHTEIDPNKAMGQDAIQDKCLLYSNDPRGINLLIEWLETYHVPYSLCQDLSSFMKKLQREVRPFFLFVDVGFDESEHQILDQLSPYLNTKACPFFLATSQKQVILNPGINKSIFIPLFKPFVSKHFIYILQNCSNTEKHPQPSIETVTSIIPSSLNVLVVEDNRVNYKVAQRMLLRMGLQVEHAVNGLEAVKAVLGPTHFDLILMDCHMPVMDGWEATRTIRNHTGFENQPPIIALTANALAGTKERCLESGMQGFLTKPIKFNELKQMVDLFLDGESL